MAANAQPGTGTGIGRYERTDASTRGLVIFSAVITLLLLLSAFAMKWWFDYLEASDSSTRIIATPFDDIRVLPPLPRLQTTPHQDIRAYQDSQQRRLTTYEWMDRPNGRVRIPIDRAMQLLLERGLPTRSPAPASGTQATGAPDRDTESSQFPHEAQP